MASSRDNERPKNILQLADLRVGPGLDRWTSSRLVNRRFRPDLANVRPEGQQQHEECHEWPVQTAQFVDSESPQTECGARGRFNVNNWPHSVSIGSPSRGALVYAEALMPNQFLTSRKHKRFGTRELVSTIERAVAVVNAKFPNTPVLHVGDLSRKNGGFFLHIYHINLD